MAEKRMFTKKITDSDAFTSLPPTAQALYFHLCMGADDDGFSDQIRRAMFNAHASTTDFENLAKERFIIPFESGVVVVKHWRMHNIIKNDRYKETTYVEEKSQLVLTKNGVYTERGDIPESLETQAEPEVPVSEDSSGTSLEPEWNQSGSKLEPQIRLDKDRLDYYTENFYTKSSSSVRRRTFCHIMSKWNDLKGCGIKPIRSISGKREECLRARLRQYGEESFDEVVEKIKESDFLQGKNGRGWTVTFDWLILPSNYPKVLEGNYDNGTRKSKEKYEQRIENLENWGKQFEE